MENQVTNNANALRLFFTEDVFLVEDKSVKIPLVDSSQTVNDSVNLKPESAGNENLSSNQAETPATSAVIAAKDYAKTVEIPPIVAEPKSPKVFKHLGGNQKSVLILVNDNTNAVSTEQGRDLLRKICKAIDLGNADFALVNYDSHKGTQYADFHAYFKPRIMLSFGVAVTDLQLDVALQNEIIDFNGTKIILAPNLHQLDSDLPAKKQLWGNLQNL